VACGVAVKRSFQSIVQQKDDKSRVPNPNVCVQYIGVSSDKYSILRIQS
jgi:hypothetical protein